jgi:hypothetical protein
MRVQASDATKTADARARGDSSHRRTKESPRPACDGELRKTATVITQSFLAIRDPSAKRPPWRFRSPDVRRET